ncbi:MAG: glycoside hydrolase family 127 protein [Bacteroidales bacterium]
MKKYSFLIFFLNVLSLWAYEGKYTNVRLNDVQPKGWIQYYLNTQKLGLTGNLDTLSYPFNSGGWIGKLQKKTVKNGTVVPNWIPYEQTGYYYDGVLRCGILLKDSVLINKAYNQYYGAIKKAGPSGVILSELAGIERSRWPHAVFFRGYMAAYESYGDPVILESLENHYKNDTVYYDGRDICNIEQLLWLYQQTGKKEYLKKSESIFLDYCNKSNSASDVTLANLASDERLETHAVTFHEMLKLPILLYCYTGNQHYLDAARKGFRKLDQFHMMADGVPSSEEGLSEKDGLAAHEACNISDYSWACTYMLKATGEVEWADKIERAVLNAGLSSVTKDFDAHQYYSSCNQVVCGSGSSHAVTYGASRFAYRQYHRPPCCTGNINRFMPIYVGAQWLKGKNNTLVKALYGPGSYQHDVNGQIIVIEEKSVFPFTDNIELEINEGTAKFPLHIRVPSWAKNAEILLNDIPLKNVRNGSFFEINRMFTKGDRITLKFKKQAEYIKWVNNGMIVNYGPLLFSLPIKAKEEKYLLDSPKNGVSDTRSAGLDLYPDSKWNYILGVDGLDNSLLSVVHHPIENENIPWVQEKAPIQIIVPMHEDKTWRPFYREYTDEWTNEVKMSLMTPPVPSRGAMIIALRRSKPEGITLVPYAYTYLKMTVFPFWAETEISPEIIAADE